MSHPLELSGGELPALPPSWCWVKIGDLQPEFQNGLASRGEHGGSPTVVLRLADVSNGTISLKTARSLPVRDVWKIKYSAMSNDILIVRVNGSTDIVGQFIVCNFDNLVYCDHFIRMRTQPDVTDHRFLALLGSSPIVRSQIERLFVSTAGQKTVNQRHVSSIVIPLPPRPEQDRIVSAIEEQFSRLDAGIAALRRARQNLNRMRDAVLRAAVTGKSLREDSTPIAPDTSLDRPLSASLTGENARKVERATRGLMPRTWDIPPSWTWKAAADVCEVIASGSTPVQAAMSPDSGDIPYIKVYNLTHRGYLDFTIRPTFIDRSTHEGPLRRSRLRPGDILTNIVGPPLGKVAVVPSDYPEWNTNQAVVVFRPIKSLNPKLLKYWLLSSPVLAVLESTSRATAGQFNVSLTTCRAVPLPIPPRADQDAIVADIEGKLSIIEAQEAIIDKLMVRAGTLRSVILSTAFSGKLVPQDSADEPATALIQRIAAARASSNGYQPAKDRKPRVLREEVTT